MSDAETVRLQQRAERKQQRREERRGEREAKPFSNREHWEHRYRTDLVRGSGAGSRGEGLALKHRLLEALIDDVQPRSILDVGCGDIAVAAGLSYTGAYTGVDLSPSIIARNQGLRPGWTFLHGDFLELSRTNPLKADLVICFDVLIHQLHPDDYQALTRALVQSTNRVAIINGFESEAFWATRTLPKICAFHEPLTTTLANLGVDQLETLAEFRGKAIVRIDMPPPAAVLHAKPEQT